MAAICLLGIALTCGSAMASREQDNLIRHLLKNYDIHSPPVAEIHQTLNLTLGIALLQIIAVKEKHQVLTTNILLKLFWSDTNLRWDPASFSNITQLRIPQHQIWKPDVQLYNKAVAKEFGKWEGLNVVVYSNGNVLFVTVMTVESTCRMDVTWFPFDSQLCILKFGSWTYSAWEIDFKLENASADLSEYVDNGEWELIGMTGVRTEKHYSCCSEPYSAIEYRINMKRRRFYYFFNLLMPCGLIGFLAILGFTLPPDSGEKLSLGVTVLFSLIVFLNMISQAMPANSDAIPLLGTYFNCVMVMIASSVVSTIVVNLNQRSSTMREIEGRPKRLFLHWLPWLLRMTPPDFLAPLQEQWDVKLLDETHEAEAARRLHFKRKKITEQWKFVAIVVDRICLIVSFMFTLAAAFCLTFYGL